jgi:hypothetical protein
MLEKVTAAFVEVPVPFPPFAITPLTVTFPAPAKVKVRPEELLAVVRSIPPLNTMPPPATEDQIGLPPLLVTLLLKVWIAVELFVIPLVLMTVIALPDHVYAFAPGLKIIPPIVSPATVTPAPLPKLPNAAISVSVGTALLVQEAALVQTVPVLFHANTGAGFIVIVNV